MSGTHELLSFSGAGVQGVRLTRKRQVIKGVPRIASTHEKQAYWLFENLTVEVAAGDILAVVSKDAGRSGAALRAWAGLLPLDAGTLQAPQPTILITPPPTRWVRELSVEQGVWMLAGTYGLDDAQIEQMMPAVIKTAQLNSVLHEPIEEQGKHLRSQIAFAIGVHAPVPVVMFDHTASVGSPAFRSLCPQLLTGLGEQGKAVVLTTTRPQVVLDAATRGLILRPRRGDQVDVTEAAEFLVRSRAKGRKRARELFDDEDDSDSGLDF